MRKAQTPALRLLLASARAHPSPEDETAIRQLLKEGVDWAPFAQKTLDHGLAGLAGHSLARLVPNEVPPEILKAFQDFIDQTRASNLRLLNQLAQQIEMLAAAGVKAIPFKGPVLAQQAFGDLGLRGFRDLDYLIHDQDVAQTIKVLEQCGYARDGDLTPAQFSVIHRLQGQEIMFNPDKCPVEPHTRLTSRKMALDIDYAGLWQRARQDDIFGHSMLTFAPEDTMVVLAVHGGKELWWDIKWACDVADFIASHPALDWDQVAARARAQGCYRMLLLATALSHRYLGARIPDFLVAEEARDKVVGDIIGRVLSRWEADDPGGPPSNKTLSMDRLRLHDGLARKAGYVLRTLFLPGPQHIALVALSGALEFLYIPIGLAHDRLALPLYRLWRGAQAQASHLRTQFKLSPWAPALAPISFEARKRWKHHQQAYRNAAKLLAGDPKDHAAWSQMGDALSGLNRLNEAITCYDKALALAADNDSIWKKRGAAMAALTGDPSREPPLFDISTADGWAKRSGFLLYQARFNDASKTSQNALRIAPGHEAATRIGIRARLYACDWRKRDEDKSVAAAMLAKGVAVTRPINLKQLFDSEEMSLSLAQLLAGKTRTPGTTLWRGERYRHDKIRIAYLSSDFRNHPVGWTIVAPLEHHDKTRFEITAVSLGPDDGSAIRKRIQAAASRFLDLREADGETIAKMLRDMEIDIAIDLNGLTGTDRDSILAWRPAPLQVNYLGYPGTMGAPYIDYLIADPVLIPEENRAFYREKIAYLPNSYLPCDGKRLIAAATPTRAEQGLPQTGFVFTCFNNLHKLGPETFAIWMRLLRAVEGSVLWLSSPPQTVMAHLHREAAANGVAPERLVFARFEKQAQDHLARQSLGDLFLDTLPYNAHSTAGEALCAGLPLLTCLGGSFQGRVAASLLHAAGLPELITTSPAEYENRALELARDPARLAAIRQKLAQNRASAPLFDSARFTCDLERVYTAMWRRQQDGLAPEGFSITGR
jgi:predicted O-linked N-acetylglucosamine transferase (SPINDLY family)